MYLFFLLIDMTGSFWLMVMVTVVSNMAGGTGLLAISVSVHVHSQPYVQLWETLPGWLAMCPISFWGYRKCSNINSLCFRISQADFRFLNYTAVTRSWNHISTQIANLCKNVFFYIQFLQVQSFLGRKVSPSQHHNDIILSELSFWGLIVTN